MSKKRLLTGLLILIFCATAAYVAFRLVAGRGGGKERIIDTRLDSLNLHYLLFDKENRKSIEIWAKQSVKGEKGRLHLKGVRAILFKKGRMDEDVNVEAGEGSATPDFFEFEIYQNARIFSSSIDLRGERFKLINREHLTTSSPAEFRYEDISGNAARGLDFFFKEKDIRINGGEGRFILAGKEYLHKEEKLAFFHDKHVLTMEKVDYLRAAGSLLSAERFYIQLSDDLHSFKYSLAGGSCYLLNEVREKDGTVTIRETHTGGVENIYDDQGRQTQSKLLGGSQSPEAELIITRGKNRTTITATILYMFFDVASGSLQRMEGVTALIDHQGKEKFRLFSQQSSIENDANGELDSFSGSFGCRLEWESVKGYSHRVFFQNKKSIFTISGEPARIEREGSTFLAPEFTINTRTRLLSTAAGVQATIAPKPGEKSLFFEKPAYITAQGMELRERQNDLLFQRDVKLVQEESEIRCGRLRLLQQKGQHLLKADGGAVLKLASGGERFVLEAESIQAPPAERRIELDGSARLSNPGQGQELRAERIVIRLAADDRIESVGALNRVSFNTAEAAAGCEIFEWNYIAGLALLRKAAKITQKGITTMGEEIRFDIKANEIIGKPRGKEGEE